ncbi:hypothetical protein HDU87_006667 [Geranomyces variabilis]|uniref:Carrier domain-containing protein n=1 Tax=Geranomyces variabilis TaxID=109894 RepID=A0AAD5XKW5_9FUNG|nr:hypothetical protein HDU87_006667 [Geranomyces variabilis]
MPSSSFPQHIRHLLRDAASKFPTNGISYIQAAQQLSDPTFQSYADLHGRATSISSALKAAGLQKNQIVVLYFDNHRDNIEFFWGAVLAGLLPCVQGPINTRTSKKTLHPLAHLNTILQKPAILTSRDLTRADFSSFPNSCDLNVVIAEDLEPQTKLPTSAHPVRTTRPAENIALLLLTSGSTGNAKAVPLHHDTIIAAGNGKIDDYELESSDTIVNWVGFDHVACVVENHLTPMLAGANQVQVSANVVMTDPGAFLKILDRFRASLTLAPNFLLARLNDYLDQNPRPDIHDLSPLRRINSGGEALVVNTGRQLLEKLKALDIGFRAIIAPGFGMTETCAGFVYSKAFPHVDEGHEFACLGYAFPGAEMRIVDSQNRLLADGTCGHLQVRGPTVFSGYYNNDAATREAFAEGGWFKTGDRGVMRAGKLTLTGRAKDTFIINGVNFHCAELQAMIEDVPGVSPSFVAAIPTRRPNSQHEDIAILYLPTFRIPNEIEQLRETQARIRDKCVIYCAKAPCIVLPLPKEAMTKGSLGKLSTGKLRKLLESGELKERETLVDSICRKVVVSPATATESAILAGWSTVFGLPRSEISVEDNILHMGGSSLELMRFRSFLLRQFDLDDQWQVINIMRHPTIRSLAALLDGANHSPMGEINATYNPVIPLQTTGEGTPIFFVHPGVGEVLIFVNLAKHFAHERPFYALRARGFDPNETFFGSMDEMVEEYVAGIITTQPFGPYLLAGYSYGGVVAFEIAKRLEGDGRHVIFLGLVNIPPYIRSRMEEISWTEGLLNLSYFLDLTTKEEAERLAPPLKELSRRQQIRHVLQHAPPERVAELVLDATRLDHWVNIAWSLLQCGRNYEPSGAVHGCRLTCFYANPLKGTKTEWRDNHLSAWDQFAGAGVDFVAVAGHHYTLMNSTHARGFHAALKEQLRAAAVM